MMSLVVNESDVTNVNIFNLDIELDFKGNAIGLYEFTSWPTISYQIFSGKWKCTKTWNEQRENNFIQVSDNWSMNTIMKVL